MIFPAVEELAASVEQAWRKRDYEPRAFSELASAAICGARLVERLAPDEIIKWVFRWDDLPQQADPRGTFGEPPVTLYRSRRFYIDALFWIDGTTTIHQHAFSGAFCVLAGSSVETRFSFDLERNIDGHFQIGKLQVASTELLQPGDVRPISSGPPLIHSLFHLERPSVTIVVRTYRDADAGPQFEYARPGIGHDPFFSDPSCDRAVQLIKMLRKIEHPKFEELVGSAIVTSDPHTGYRLLRECVSLPDRELFDRLVQRIRDREISARLAETFQQTRRLTYIQSRRALVKDTDLRFFLGVLLNAHRRVDVMKLVGARESGTPPERTIAVWLRRLSSVAAKLQAGGVGWEPNLLGLPPFTDQLEDSLQSVVAGRSTPNDPETVEFISRLRELPALSCLWD